MRRALWAQPPSSPPRPGLRHGDDRIWSDTCPVRYREQEESRAAQRARSERIELELELAVGPDIHNETELEIDKKGGQYRGRDMWICGWVDGWMHGRMDGWMCGSVGRSIDRSVD